MRRRNVVSISSDRKMHEPLPPHSELAAMFAIAVLPLLLLWSLLPRPLVLPVFCLVSIAGAAVTLAVAWRRRTARHSSQINAWDVAGALAFIGFAAGMLSNPEQVIYLTDSAATLARIE